MSFVTLGVRSVLTANVKDALFLISLRNRNFLVLLMIVAVTRHLSVFSLFFSVFSFSFKKISQIFLRI